MNKYTKTFSKMLDVMDFSLLKEDDGYFLLDVQIYLDDIWEYTRTFHDAAEIVDSLNVFLNEYYLKDLRDEAEAYHLDIDSVDVNSFESWDRFAKTNKSKDVEVAEFIKDHQHEFDVADMLTNHLDRVQLSKITIS